MLRQQDRWWWLAGLAVGLSTYNKWLIALLVAAVVGGILLSGPRKVLVSRAFLGAAGLAVLLALPNLVWQAVHGWPQLDMGRALAAHNAEAVRLLEVPTLLVMIGPVLFPVCVAGVVALLRRPEWRPVRWLAPATAIMAGNSTGPIITSTVGTSRSRTASALRAARARPMSSWGHPWTACQTRLGRASRTASPAEPRKARLTSTFRGPLSSSPPTTEATSRAISHLL